MDTIIAKLQFIITRYRARGLNNGDDLLAPADVNDIVNTEQHLGFPLPPPLHEIYAVFGGHGYIDPGTTGLFGSHRLHTPKEIASSYQMYQEAELTAIECLNANYPNDPPTSAEDLSPPPGSLPGGDLTRWHPALIPFASWDAYSLVMCRHTHRIFEFEPYQGLSDRNFKSMDQFLDAVLIAASNSDCPDVDFNTPDLESS
jgi:cell wall assembly regulator SMI1